MSSRYHHFLLSGLEVFTPIFLQFLPKTRLAKYDDLLHDVNHHWRKKQIKISTQAIT